MRYLLSSAILLAVLTVLSLSGCYNECGDQGYLGVFYLTDKKTGKPYFQVSKDSPDSVRVFIGSPLGRQAPYIKNYDDRYGYILGDVDLYGTVDYALYIYLNQSDTDTLIISNLTTRVYGKCDQKSFLTSATYNGHPLRSISSDTTGGIVRLNLIK